MQAFITKGCFTDHGGIIQQGDDFWQVDGKGIHLEGMTHYCPKCKVQAKAIGSDHGFMKINDKNPIIAGDLSTCGAKYLKISDLAVRDKGIGSGVSSVLNLSNQKQLYSGQFQLMHEIEGTPIANTKYKITYDDGTVVEGITDDQGYTEVLEKREQSNDISVELLDQDESW